MVTIVQRGQEQVWDVSCVILTAVFLIASVRTVAEAVAAETSDDAVDAVSTGEERRGTLGLELRWEKMES